MSITLTSTCIYCPPSLATPTTITGTDTIERGKLVNLVELWQSKHAGQLDTYSVVASLVAAYFGGAIYKKVIGACVKEAVTLARANALEGAFETLLGFSLYKLIEKNLTVESSVIKDIANLSGKNIKVTYTFKYIRSGSNDGAYFLDSMKVSKA